jgi:putative oxidoreductase
MKIVILIARLLLGLIFLVFGLNGFLNFLKGPMPSGLALQFVGALIQSHYFWVVAGLQVAGGALLLLNRFVPFALVLLGPVIVNIICYHVFLNPSGPLPAAVVTVLWLIVFYGKRQYFSGIFAQRT